MVTTVVPIIQAVTLMVVQLVRVGMVAHPTIPDGVQKITHGGEVTAVFTGEVVLAPVMAVVNMGVKQVGGGAVPLIRMYRLMLTQMGRCALPSQMVW